MVDTAQPMLRRVECEVLGTHGVSRKWLEAQAGVLRTALGKAQLCGASTWDEVMREDEIISGLSERQ